MNSVNIGNAGEHLVVAELLARGHHAAMADRANPAFDVLAICNGKHAAIRVKTSTHNGTRFTWSAKRDGSVFSQLGQIKSDFVAMVYMPDGPRSATFYIVPTRVVNNALRRLHRAWLAIPRRDGKPHKDTNMRGFLLSGPTAKPWRGYATRWQRYHEAWNLLEES